MTGTTTVYPKKGVTLYLPGGVHGFTASHPGGIPMPSAHASPLVSAGHLETDASRKATAQLAAAEAREVSAEAALQAAQSAAKTAAAAS